MRISKRWSGFRSVLCAVDFSEPSRLALQYAEAVADRGNAALRVLYVNDPLLIAAAAAALHDRQFAQRSGQELRRFVDETAVTPERCGLTSALRGALITRNEGACRA